MSFDLQQLKQDVDKRTTHLIFGFVHEAQSLFPTDLSYFNINDLISFIILSFYYVRDKWDQQLTNLKYFKIDNDCLSIYAKGNHMTNAYLKRVVTEGIHTFRLKIEKEAKDNEKWLDFVIGVVDQSFKLKQEPVNYQKAYFVGSKALSPQRKPYGKMLKQGDIIEMIINMDNLTLKFIINGTDYGKISDLKPGKYRAAIYMYQVGNTLKIV